MPASAYLLVAIFTAVSAAVGALTARLIGPRRPWAAALPALASFAALYLIGHRWVVSIGPTVRIAEWDVALPFDVSVALVVGTVVALLQRAVVRLLQPEQRRTRSDGLA